MDLADLKYARPRGRFHNESNMEKTKYENLFVETWGTIVACGSSGTLLLWYVVAHTPGDAGMTTWRTAKEAPPPTEPPATSAG